MPGALQINYLGANNSGLPSRALVADPPVLLADEPTGNLDTQTSIEIMMSFQHLNRERGITVLLVTHEPDIAAYSRRLIRMKDGSVLYDGPAAEGLQGLASDQGRHQAGLELA